EAMAILAGDALQALAFELLAALRKVIERLPERTIHEIFAERVSLADKISHVMERLGGAGSATFEELFADVRDRFEVVITFLAILELVKMRAARLHQAEAFGTIRVYVADAEEDEAAPQGAPTRGAS
ncbi:MAG: segregation/condensation protein A, partial [Candidatus Methylomirabilis sp.]|nr:segregation/condensation protein A [Deltaproteobacteria bacterium]